MYRTVTKKALAVEDVYSVLLPTYNERENLPILVHMIVRTLESRLGDDAWMISRLQYQI